ncbi:hypothetical protein [Bdellovibrio sp. HCB337]|uniref:hypothetical protein n=1 Tax=Bdellovibrio sp. HCB337 TaxID=3394358 RepID=UPI0039A5DC19
MRTKIFILIVGLIGSSLIACTRAAKDDTAKVSIALPKTMAGKMNAASSTMELTHVAINASGSGMNTVVYSWDSCHDCQNASTTIPSSFSVAVPSGSGRLIQILAVYEDPDSQQMMFYYGDTTAEISGATMDLNINVAQVGAGNITSGRVSGRYFKDTSSGPTGVVDIKYNPGNGKLPLIVDRGIIVNGWFSMFMLSGANLQYVVRETGEMLWGQEMSFESSAMNPSENSGAYFDQRARAFLPIHIEQRDEGGTISYKKAAAETFVWGYWGPGAVGKKVCTSGLDGSPVPQKLKRYVDTNLASAPEIVVSHYINHSLTVPTKAQLTDTANPYGYIVVEGGQSMSSSCGSFADTATNQYSNFQKVTLDLFDGNGGDSVAGFRGIFRNTSVYNFVDISGDPKAISGQVLPGVEAVFDGLRFFKKPTTTDMHMDVVDCANLGGEGFISGASSDGVINSSTGAFTLTSNITTTEASAGVSGALCPMKSGKLAPIGVFLGKWMFSMGGGSSVGGGNATQLATVMLGTKVANYICTPFFVEGRTANNSLGHFNGSMTYTFSADGGDTYVYSDSSCSNQITAPYTTNNPNQTFFVKRAVGGVATRTMTVTSSLPTVTQTLSFLDSTGTPFIKTRVQPNIYAHGCYTMSYIAMLQNGGDSMVADIGGSYTVNPPSLSGLNYYYTSGAPCSTPGSPSMFINSSNLMVSTSFSYTGAATTLNLDAISASGSPTYSGGFGGGSSVSVAQPGANTYVQLGMNNSFSAESCQSLTLRSVDSAYNLSPATQAITLNFTFNGSGTLPTDSGFYSDPSCNSPTAPPSIAASTTQSSMVYFRWTVPGTISVNASVVSGPAGVSFQTMPLTVGSFAVGNIIIYPTNGVTFTWPTTFTGVAMPVQKGQPFNITLEARSPLGNLIFGFNDTNAGPSGVNIHDTYSSLNCGTILWYGTGYGSVTCSVPNAPDYFSSMLLQLKTGGGGSMYPMFYGGTNMRVSRAAEEVNTLTYLLSKPFSYYSNTCQPLLVARGQNTGSHFAASTVSSGMSFNSMLTYNTGVAGFYSNASCSSSITQTTLASGESAALVYVKMDGNAPPNGLAMQADNNGVADAGTSLLTFSTNAAPSTFTQYKVSMSANQYYKLCSPVMIVRTDANGAAVAAGSSDIIVLNSDFTGSWYSDASCSATLPANNATFSTGETAKLVYFRPDIMSGGGSVNVSNAGSETGSFTGINVQP